MKIGIVQYAPAWEEPESNIEKIDAILKNTSDEEVLIFPEMTLTGFTMNSEKFAEEIDGISHKYFMRLAVEKGKEIIAGLIERDGDSIYNSLVHFDGKGLIGAKYRKIHPFTYAKENEYYAPGDEVVASKVCGLSTGLTICYDLRFPELYRLIAKKGAGLIINIANWPVKRIAHWKALLKARAIENQAFVVGVNRVGSDPYNEYNGSSGVYDPMGLKLMLTEETEGLLTVEIDPKEIEETRERLPFLNDMKLI